MPVPPSSRPHIPLHLQLPPAA
ncbi:hypothetical protein AZE42_07568 [Rhizopogon vesiculosus]|uniref:Uncharacterized protein n=1 Tax=Rhizopogon vesiculosus TaxID=180088 RepID=A0A1J8Q977_9AGAM|nr:hypothetical protein AZE42_07568 [Rhizopogon vesiculosus]